MNSTRLHEVILYVQNIHEQLAFYRDTLGLRVTFPREDSLVGDLHWVTFETGACTLALHSGGTCDFGNDAPRFVFAVDDIEQSRSEMIERKVLVSETRSPAPGIMIFDAVDPEGNKFSFESLS